MHRRAAATSAACALLLGLQIAAPEGGAAADALDSPAQEWVWDPGAARWGLWSWDGAAWRLTAVAPAAGYAAAVPAPSAPVPEPPGATAAPPAPQSPTPAPTATNGPGAGGTQAGTTFDGTERSGTLTSTHWPGHQARWRAATPSGASRGTVIVLHGRDDNADAAFDGLALAEQARRTGFVLVAVDGGNGFWHDDGGVDPGRMVVEDLLPALSAEGIDTSRIALTGYSMGGAGALLLGEALGPQRVWAVAPMSAAVWEGGHGGVEGKAQEAVRANAGRLAGIPTRIACGTDDHLIDVNRSFAPLVPGALTELDQPGGHDHGYWSAALARQLDWMASLPR